jgi:hypothetical protein
MAELEELQAQLQAQNLLMQEMQEEMRRLHAAAVASDPPSSPQTDLVNALTEALANRPNTVNRDYSRDLEKFDNYSSEETGKDSLSPQSFLSNLNDRFELLSTPADQKVLLVKPKLRGKALTQFEAFTNAAGKRNDAKTTTWEEFETLILRLQPSDESNLDKIQRTLDTLVQKSSAANYVLAYQKFVIDARRNPLAQELYTEAFLINAFRRGLKPDVKVHLTEMKFATLEEAYAAAERKDVNVHAARMAIAAPPGPGPRRNGWNPRASPAPPGPPPPHHLSAIGKDHSVPLDQPIPKMTPDIKTWCLKNNACFRCRLTPEQQDKLLGERHQSGACPRFAGTPDRERLAAVADEEDSVPGNDQ